MKNVLFRNKETGEIVTSFNLLDIAKYEEVKEETPEKEGYCGFCGLKTSGLPLVERCACD